MTSRSGGQKQDMVRAAVGAAHDEGMTNQETLLHAEAGARSGRHRADRAVDAASQARHEPGLKDADLCRVGCPHHTPDTYASRRAKHRRAPQAVAS